MYDSVLADEARFDATQRELLNITWRLLDAIHTGNVDTYAQYSVNEVSCFEDVCPYRIDGLKFHLTLIKQMAQNAAMKPTRFDLLSPRVQVYGDCGIVTYTRLMTFNEGGKPHWTTANETRVFSRFDGAWKMVHVHRSNP